VARQLGKHQVGMVWNEVSRRYVDEPPELYHPSVNGWRKRAENVKQGSSEEEATLPEGIWHDDIVMHFNEDVVELYMDLIKRHKVAPEQARMVLPQSMYTEWFWTGNLYSFANVFIQRTDSHAQREVQDVAHQIGDIIEPLTTLATGTLATTTLATGTLAIGMLATVTLATGTLATGILATGILAAGILVA